MRVLGVIPARGGSKGVARKNIRLLAGLPLIGWTINAAASSKRLARKIVSTDDTEIAQIAEQLGADIPFMRPAHLATDSSKSIDVVLHALHAVEAAGDSPYDAVFLLQPTTPFRTSADIDGSIDLLENSGADSVISVVAVGGFHPARMKYLDHDNRLIDPEFCEVEENMPRQKLRPMYLRAGSVYVTRRETILAGSFKGQDSRAWVVPVVRAVNIDTEDDFLYATWLASRGAS